MKNNIVKKIMRIGGLLSIFLSGAINANSYCPSDFCPPQTCAYNAPYTPDIRCAFDVFATGSFLYWEAKEEGLEPFAIYTEDNQGDPALGVSGNKSYTMSSMDFDFKPAFKVGLGIHFDCDDWEVYGEYTWYHHEFEKSPTVTILAANQTFNQIRPCFVINMETDNLDPFNFRNLSSAKWNLKLDLGDLELARQYFVGQFLTFRTHYGLRGAWIKQKLHQNWEGRGQTGQATANDTLSYDVKHKSSSWAVGPRAGVNTKWHFCGGFRLFGNISAALLYTDYKISGKENQFNAQVLGTGPALTTVSTENNIETIKPCFLRPQADLGLGIGWGDYFCSCKWYFDIAIGYDFNIFWNQNMFAKILNIAGQDKPTFPHGDLYLHGLTVKVMLDF